MRIYVGNFTFETSETELRQVFQDYGQIQEISIIEDRYTGRSKGFAFIEMPAVGEAEAAITALNGKEMNGRTITVNEARPRPERSFGGGEFGNRSGGDNSNNRDRGSRW
jgi:cold-inducible RNA-binding protein